MRTHDSRYARAPFAPLRTVLSAVLAVGVALGNVAAAATPIVPPVEASRTRESYVARGKRGMIAAAHPLASAAAIAMLEGGGNAVDAAVAASFVISVVRPQSTGIGGGGFLLHRAAGKATAEVFDFRERAPAKATRDMYLDAKGAPASFRWQGKDIPEASVNGHLAVGVPGLVAGLVDVHKRYGTLALARVMEPAIRAAEDGFAVYGGLAEAIAERADVLKVFPGSAAIFLPNGIALKAGDVLVQKDLAWTLRQVAARGAAGFYQGDVAAKLVAEMKRGKGLVTQADLAAYQVKRRDPVVGTYRGHKIFSMPPPSSGGVHIVQMLNMLSGDDYGALGWGSAPAVHLLTETMRRAFADRAEYLGDPEFAAVPVRGLVAPAYASALRKTIDMTKATPSSAVKPGRPMDHESPSTTHLSVVDRWGNAVATTQTVNYTFGSCVVAEGTGVVLNDEMDDFSIKPGVPNAYGLVGSAANAVAAKKTMLSSMSPTMVFTPEGRLELVVGSPGGPRIISATLQTIINVIDFKMPLADAVHAPRIHHQWLPDEMRAEKGAIEPEVLAKLTAMGHKVAEKGTVGDVQAVGVGADGAMVGVSDTRSEGAPRRY